MELSAVLATLRRRWYLAVVALGLTAAFAVLVVVRVGPNYSAQGTMLLFPPKGTTHAGEQVEGNPYLFLGGLNIPRDILIRTMTSKSTREQIEKANPDVDYEMAPDLAVSSPVIVIEVTGPTEEEAIATLTALMKRVPATLNRLQGDLGISKAEYITIQTLTVDPQAELVRKGQIRAGIVATGGASAVSALLIGLLDGLLLSRRTGERKPREQRQKKAPPGRPRGPAGSDRAGERRPRPQQKKKVPPGRKGGAAVPQPAGSPKPPSSPARSGEARGRLTTVAAEADDGDGVDRPAAARR